MIDDNDTDVFAHQARVSELFRLHNTGTPQPSFGESPAHYRLRVLSCAQSLLPRDHVFSGINLAQQRNLAAVEQHVIFDRVENFKKPVGPLREVRETCPETGRTVKRFFGSPEEAWAPFKQQPRRAQFVSGLGRGANSPQAQARAVARAAALKAAGL